MDFLFWTQIFFNRLFILHIDCIKDACTLHLFPNQIGPRELLNSLIDTMTPQSQAYMTTRC